VAVRVRLRVKNNLSGKVVEAVALLNSGFETLKPQLLIPVKLAEVLGLWPSLPESSYVKEYGTAGGITKTYVVPENLVVCVVTDGRCSPTAVSDSVISLLEEEALIGDKLAGKLGIMVFDFAEGIWKLKIDPPDKMRESEPPQYWTI